MKLVLVAAVLALASGGATAPTRLSHWTAFRAGKVAAGVHVVQRGRGSCWEGSMADGRADAWRCFRGNEIVDPCFSGGGATVLCPVGTPDSRDALSLRLTKPLPRAQANSGRGATPGEPWAIVTARGDYCYRLTGTIDMHAGRALTYGCAGAAMLAGPPARTKPRWTVPLLPSATAKRFVVVGVRAAWW